MNWWLAAGAALLAAAALLWPIRVGLRVHAGAGGLVVQALYNLGGPLKGALRLPVSRLLERLAGGAGPAGQPGAQRRDGSDRSVWEEPGWTLVVGMLRIAIASLRTVDRFECKTRIGTGDAASTSWCTGLLWALGSGTIAALSRKATWLSPPRFGVEPDFAGVSFLLDATCIFRFRCGEIILAAVLYAIRRVRKGGG